MTMSPDSARSMPFGDMPPLDRPRSRSSVKSTDSRASRSSKGSGWRIFARRSSKASSEMPPRLSAELGGSPMASPTIERQRPMYHIPPPTSFQYSVDEVERLDSSHRHPPLPAGASGSGGGGDGGGGGLPPLASPQPRRPNPVPRSPSHNSLYSNYSFYSFPPPEGDPDGIRSPSPTPSQSISQRAYSPAPSSISPYPPVGGGGGLMGGGHSTFAKTKASISFPKTKGARTNDVGDPNYCLQLAITHHERGELERAAYYFERSAKERGGCGPGMLLWGLSLRHGWGCHANPSLAFAFLQKAAESVVDDLDRVVEQGLVLGDKEREAKAAKVCYYFLPRSEARERALTLPFLDRTE
jgi:hypothetical protein